MIPGPYEKPEAYWLPASHTAGLAVQVCDSHFRTLSHVFLKPEKR